MSRHQVGYDQLPLSVVRHGQWTPSVGREILDRQEQAGWGSWVIDRPATALRAEFPDQRGRYLHYMRALAEVWPHDFVQEPAARLPWGHVMVLLDRLSSRQGRDWYAAAAGEYGWSQDVLARQVGRISRAGRRRRTSPPHCRRRTPSWRSSWCQPVHVRPSRAIRSGCGARA